MDHERARWLVTSYVAGWKDNDVDQVLDTLTPDGTIVESHGPTFHGHDQVRRWLAAWFGAGQAITAWDITTMVCDQRQAAFEWVFTCTGDWGEATLEGATVVTFGDGRIARLHEYRRTEPPYPGAPPQDQ